MKLEIVNNDPLTLISKSPFIEFSLLVATLISLVVTLLFIKHKYHKKVLGNNKQKMSFISYSKTQLHLKKKKPKQSSIDVESALHTTEEIIEENS